MQYLVAANMRDINIFMPVIMFFKNILFIGMHRLGNNFAATAVLYSED